MPCALEPKMYFFFAIDPSPFPMPFFWGEYYISHHWKF